MKLVELRSQSRNSEPEDRSYHQGWYPVALSSEIGPGALLGKDFLGTRVIVYRDPGGQAVVQSAYCPHLGADLSVGELVDGRVRCAYHHWSFDAQGACAHIPTGDKIPPQARIFNYHTLERWGAVWAYNGPKPLFEPPRLPGAEEHEVVFETRASDTRPVEHWLSTSNALDFQHLRALHNVPVTEPDEIEFGEYDIQYGYRRGADGRQARINGTNTFSACQEVGGREVFLMFSRTPIARGLSNGIYLVGVRKPANFDAEARAQLAGVLAGMHAIVQRLFEEDAMVLKTIRFRQGTLTAADRHLSRFFDYVRRFPRAEPLDP